VRKIGFLLFVMLFVIPQVFYANDQISVYIDGQKQSYSEQPVIKNGSTLVPMRAIFETLGAEVNWNQAEHTIFAKKDCIDVVLKIGSNSAIVNRVKKDISVPAQLIKNKTFVPLRFIAQSLGADVNWNGLTRTITIQSKDLNCGKGSDNGVPVSEDQRLSNDSGIGDFEREVFLLVNEERKKAGLPGLVFDEELSVVAEEKSRDMAENDYFDHQSPTYGSPFEMMEFFGIKYRTAGENIAAGYQTPENVVKAWMNSPGHRANILNKNFKQIGIGYVKVPGSEYVTYWTQMFRAE